MCVQHTEVVGGGTWGNDGDDMVLFSDPSQSLRVEAQGAAHVSFTVSPKWVRRLVVPVTVLITDSTGGFVDGVQKDYLVRARGLYKERSYGILMEENSSLELTSTSILSM